MSLLGLGSRLTPSSLAWRHSPVSFGSLGSPAWVLAPITITGHWSIGHHSGSVRRLSGAHAWPCLHAARRPHYRFGSPFTTTPSAWSPRHAMPGHLGHFTVNGPLSPRRLNTARIRLVHCPPVFTNMPEHWAGSYAARLSPAGSGCFFHTLPLLARHSSRRSPYWLMSIFWSISASLARLLGLDCCSIVSRLFILFFIWLSVSPRLFCLAWSDWFAHHYYSGLLPWFTTTPIHYAIGHWSSFGWPH